MLKYLTSLAKYLLCAGITVAGLLCYAAGATPNRAMFEPTKLNSDEELASLQTQPLRSRRFHEQRADQQKYIAFPTTGWSNGVIHWRYNDAGRISSIASAAAMISLIQTEQSKWSAVCKVQFIYDGTSSSPPSLVTSSSFDGVNVIGWGAESAPQTGDTGIGWALPEPGPILEGDMELNNTFNPDVSKTVLHELGHMLGLQHSNVANVVMSGPPQTSYASLSTLQPDDIAGCRALYGAPVATNVAISGTISNGGGIAGVTFCATPATGVTCTASNASGAYSCTVPSGWTGTLFSPSVSNNRIPPQAFTNVTSATTRNVTALSGVPSCNLDVDNNGLIEPATDGVAILSRMLGLNAAAFSGLAGTCAANTTGTAIFNATTSNYNVTGGASTTAATDGLVILRAMSGKTGTDVTNGLGLTREPGATNTSWAAIQSWLNTTCGSSF